MPPAETRRLPKRGVVAMGRKRAEAQAEVRLVYLHEPREAADKEILASAEALRGFSLVLTERQESAYEQNLGSLLATAARHKVEQPINILDSLIDAASKCSLSNTETHRTLGLVMAANRILVSHFPFTLPIKEAVQKEWLHQIKSIRSRCCKGQVSLGKGAPVSLLALELMVLEASVASVPHNEELLEVAKTTVKIVTGVGFSVLKMQLDSSLFPALMEGLGHLGRWAGRMHAKKNLFQLMPIRHLEVGGATLHGHEMKAWVSDSDGAPHVLLKLQAELSQRGVRWEALASIALAITNTIVGSGSRTVLHLEPELVRALALGSDSSNGLVNLLRYGVHEQDRANTPLAVCGLWAETLADAVSFDETGRVNERLKEELCAPVLLIEYRVSEAVQRLTKWLMERRESLRTKQSSKELGEQKRTLTEMLKDLNEGTIKPLKMMCVKMKGVLQKLVPHNAHGLDHSRPGIVASRIQQEAGSEFETAASIFESLIGQSGTVGELGSYVDDLAGLAAVLRGVCASTEYDERLWALMVRLRDKALESTLTEPSRDSSMSMPPRATQSITGGAQPSALVECVLLVINQVVNAEPVPRFLRARAECCKGISELRWIHFVRWRRWWACWREPRALRTNYTRTYQKTSVPKMPSNAFGATMRTRICPCVVSLRAALSIPMVN